MSMLDKKFKELELIFKNDKSSEELEIDEVTNLAIDGILDYFLPVLNNKSISSYSELCELASASKNVYDRISEIKEEIDLRNFIKNNKEFDEVRLREMYETLNLKVKFPMFDIDKYLELINNPFFEVESVDGRKIGFNVYIVKKLLIAINQMIFNEMDLYILNIGKEGTGKSCWSSQQMLYLYIFLERVGLIKYEYDMTKMFFTDIETFLSIHLLQGYNDYFRIEVLDEGNDLNRGNFRDEENQQFKREMRTDRKQLRIIIINMQQIGELDTSISLSRINIIFDCQMSGNKRTATLNKGFGDMYIIPRDDFIYSPKYQKTFSRNEILNGFAKLLDKKKDYYMGLPKEFSVFEFTFSNVWGFDKDAYDRHVKDNNRKKQFGKGLSITLEQAYCLVCLFQSLKEENKDFIKLADRRVKRMYDVLYKVYKKWSKYFDLNPEKFEAIRKHYNIEEK